MRRAYVALTGLATLFYMAGYKIVKGEGVLPGKFKRQVGDSMVYHKRALHNFYFYYTDKLTD